MSDSETPADATISHGVLRELVEGTASATGEEFFDELVKHLARSLQTRCAWVTEWFEKERRLRALSMWVDDRLVDDYEYDVTGTPCEPVIDQCQLVHVKDRVIDLYPDDPDLSPLGAVSYMGIPLLDVDGNILGHLAVLHDERLPEDPAKAAIFSIFAGRAAAELRRVRRDRGLRERELKLSLLLESAMDAIVEVDDALTIQRANAAAGKVFAIDPGVLPSLALGRFFDGGACEKLSRLAADLEQRPAGEQSTWIPDGLTGRDLEGNEFLAEATLSRFELNGQAFFTLILRNVNDRLEAEQRIRSLSDQAAYLREEIDAIHGFDEIIGRSQALCSLLDDIERVAPGDTTVLVTGETGTGKELIARAVHRRSTRSGHPLVKVNCAAIPDQLQESEFFGHEQGAFTGATARRDGRFHLAHRGTIFLDEVGELPLPLQAKLLRVLQEGEYERVGSSTTERVDVRVIAATNRDLDSMVASGDFRRDLLYRLNVFPVSVPALRERDDDVLLLAESFLHGLTRKHGRRVLLDDDARARLRGYDWPGNVRELHNVIERAFITSTSDQLDLSRALPHVGESQVARAPDSDRTGDRILKATELQALERANLLQALEAAGWKVSGSGGAAELLGLKPNTLSSRMKSLGIERPRGG